MTRWSYFVANLNRGMISWDENGDRHEQSLLGGLTYLGSQGWELKASVPRESLGTTTDCTLIFQKPSEA